MGLTTFAFDCLPDGLRRKAAWKLLRRTSRIRRDYLTQEIVGFTGATVQAGPFAGMVMPTDIDWPDYWRDLAPMLLGVFELDLVGALESIIQARPRTVINIGAAEGYYAVGLARALPKAQIVAYEMLERAREVCRRVAGANGVEVELRGECTPDGLREALDAPATLIVDCEGAEMDLLRPDTIPMLRQCDILLECHDMVDPAITATMIERFRPSHRIEEIDEGMRPLLPHPALRGRAAIDRLLAVCEFRGSSSNWLMMTAGQDRPAKKAPAASRSRTRKKVSPGS